MSYRRAHSTSNASHSALLWVFLSVCLFCSISMLASPPLSQPSLLLAGIHTNVFLCFDFSQTQANAHKFLFLPMLLPPTLISCSSVADPLIHWSLVHMINSCLVHFFFFFFHRRTHMSAQLWVWTGSWLITVWWGQKWTTVIRSSTMWKPPGLLTAKQSPISGKFIDAH